MHANASGARRLPTSTHPALRGFHLSRLHTSVGMATDWFGERGTMTLSGSAGTLLRETEAPTVQVAFPSERALEQSRTCSGDVNDTCDVPLDPALMSAALSVVERGWYTGALEISQPSPARVYDHLVGGVHTYPVDREFGGRLEAAVPDARRMAWANAAFLARAVRHLLAAGVEQFLDLGCGMAGVASLHTVLADDAPQVRTVHVDLDPIAVIHTRDVITASGRATTAAAVHADLRRPQTILNHPTVQRLLDLGEPVAILATMVLHHLTDGDQPDRILADLREATVAGSYLVLSHLTPGTRPRDFATVARLHAAANIPIVARSRSQIRRLLYGYQLIDPGLVGASHWRPDPNEPPDEAGSNPRDSGLLAAVAQTQPMPADKRPRRRKTSGGVHG